MKESRRLTRITVNDDIQFRYNYEVMNRERMRITIVLYVVMMIPFFYFIYMKTGMSFKSFAKILSIISEAFIIE